MSTNVYRESVIPCLETNRFRPRLLAIQKTRLIAYRAKVLGRALLVVRTDLNRVWMLLSGNAEVAFPSGTTTIAAAVANPPTPGTTTTVPDSLPTAAAATATSTATPSTASASDAFALTIAAIVATPSAG
jgi:hypothetical protein